MLALAPSDEARQFSLGPIVLAFAAFTACWMLIPPVLASIRVVASISGEETWFGPSQGIGEQFERLVRREDKRALERLLCDILPDRPIRRTFLDAASELLKLQAGVGIARESGLPAIITESLAREAEVATHALGTSVARIAIVSGQGVESPGIAAALEQEAEWVERLRAVVHRAREELAEAVLRDRAGDDLIVAEQMVDWTISMIQDSTRVMDRP